VSAAGSLEHAAEPQSPAREGWRHPAVLAFALGMAVLVAGRFGLTPRTLVAAPLVAVLVVLAAIDFEQRVLPNRIVLPAAGAVLVAQLLLFPEQALEWLLASGGTGVFLLVPMLLNRDAVGMGDVKLGLLLGAGLGTDVIGALLVSFLATWPVALYLFIRHGSEARRLEIPFGPFMAIGAIVALLLG
jgi:leader peptidase (prepilin peptidase) / N-methyltransferase